MRESDAKQREWVIAYAQYLGPIGSRLDTSLKRRADKLADEKYFEGQALTKFSYGLRVLPDSVYSCFFAISIFLSQNKYLFLNQGLVILEGNLRATKVKLGLSFWSETFDLREHTNCFLTMTLHDKKKKYSSFPFHLLSAVWLIWLSHIDIAW